MNSPLHEFVIEPTIEPERYEFNSPSLHQFALARRDFCKLLGAGITVFAVTKDALATQETAAGPHLQPPQLPKEITSWLHIGDDGSFTAFTGKVEVGQNARTSLTQSVADELRVPFSSVRMRAWLRGTPPMRSGLATAIAATTDPLTRAKTAYYLVITSSDYQVQR